MAKIDAEAAQTKTHRQKIFLLAVIWWNVFLLAAVMPLAAQDTKMGAPAVRVALMDFTIDDNSYRNARSAVDFTAAVQAALQDARVEWVERAQLKAVEKELGLISAYGVADKQSAVRSGKWSKADFSITGLFSTNESGQRTLSVEAIDLDDAEVAAQETIILRASPKELLSRVIEEAPEVARKIKELIARAGHQRAENGKRTSVALLSIQPRVHTWTDPGFGSNVLARIEALVNSNENLRLSRYARATESVDEAAMLVTGLTSTDAGVLRKVADYYVWGNYDLSPRMGGQVLRNLNLYVWDGIGRPVVLTNMFGENQPLDGVVEALSKQVVERLQRRAGVFSAEPETRTQVAAQIVDQAARSSFGDTQFVGLITPEGRQQWFEYLRLLSAACFIDPSNQRALEMFLQTRWNGYVRIQSKNQFRFALGKREGWGEYGERFGVNTNTAVVREYADSSAAVLDAIYGSGAPGDVDQEIKNQWGEEASAIFRKRALATLAVNPDAGIASGWLNQEWIGIGPKSAEFIEQVWPLLIDSARKGGRVALTASARERTVATFNRTGQPGRGESLLKQLDDLLAPTTPPLPPVALPRAASLLKERMTGVILDLRPIELLPPLLKPQLTRISFPVEAGVQGVHAMAYGNGELWLSAVNSKKASFPGGNEPLGRNLAGVETEELRLWKYSPSSGQVERVSGILATNQALKLCPEGNGLWLSTIENGLLNYDFKSGVLRSHQTNSGLEGLLPMDIVATPGSLYMISQGALMKSDPKRKQWSKLDFSLPGDVTWVADKWMRGNQRKISASEDWLVYSDGPFLLVHDVRAGAWFRWDDKLAVASTEHNLGRVYCHVSGGTNGFWLGADSGLYHFSPATGAVNAWCNVRNIRFPSQLAEMPEQFRQSAMSRELKMMKDGVRQHVFDYCRFIQKWGQAKFVEPVSRIGGAVTQVMVDGDFLWIGTSAPGILFQGRVMLYHSPSKSWVGYFEAGHAVRGFEQSDKFVWIQANEVRQVEKQALYSIPRERWVSDQSIASELKTRLDKLSRHERALCAFFSGDFATAARLFEEDDLEEDPESAFFLALCQAGFALNQPAKLKAMTDFVEDRHRDSLFAGLIPGLLDELSRSVPVAAKSNEPATKR